MKLTLAFLSVVVLATAASAEPLKVGIVGLTHGHAGGFFHGSALTPAGGLLNRPDAQVVGIVEPDDKVFESYAKAFHFAPEQRFKSIAEMNAAAHPQAILIFTPPNQHRRIVEEAGPLGLHVMMEKPLATKYEDALAIERVAEANKVHVLVDFETTWYASNAQAVSLARSGRLGPIVKAVFRDGHQGPAKIGVQPEFLSWLTDPEQGGDGALIDFGCYGPSLMTWLMNGERPTSVTCVTQRLQPDAYPKCSDEAQILLAYPTANATVQASWNWTFNVKQMDLYGRTGVARVLDGKTTDFQLPRRSASQPATRAATIAPPYDDPIHYLNAVIKGEIQEGNDPTSLKNNVIVTEILDAAYRSAQSGKTIQLPLSR